MVPHIQFLMKLTYTDKKRRIVKIDHVDHSHRRLIVGNSRNHTFCPAQYGSLPGDFFSALLPAIFLYIK